MSSATTSLFKTLAITDTHLTSLFTPKPSFSSFLPSNQTPIKSLQLSSSSSSSLSWVSPKQNNFITLVAPTSDWAEETTDEAIVSEEVVEEEEEEFVNPPEEAKLFVGNLPYVVTSEQLAQLFEEAGVVQVSEVIYNRETDQSRGFGFVWMQTVEEAEKAIEKFNRYNELEYLSDERLSSLELGEWERVTETQSTLDAWKNEKEELFVYYDCMRRIGRQLGPGDVWRRKKHGELLDQKRILKENQMRQGCLKKGGIVGTKKNSQSWKPLNGRSLTVNIAAPRGSRPERPPRTFDEPSFRLYVGNLPWQVDDARLEQLFSEHGKVIQARVVYDRDTGRSRGFGFVSMSSQSEVDDAIEALDGQSLEGRPIRVNVAEERPRRNAF